jgi:hypothetical protein
MPYWRTPTSDHICKALFHAPELADARDQEQGLQASPERTLEAAAEPLAQGVDVDQNVAQISR